VDEDGNLLPKYEVAADNVECRRMSGYSLVVERRHQVTGSEQRPLDAAVVAIIDTVRVDDRLVYSKDHRSFVFVGGSLAASCLRSVSQLRTTNIRTTD